MIQSPIKERPRWITMTIPILRHTVKTPKKISKLIYQLNMRGFNTAEIRWGNPIEIDFESHEAFISNLKDVPKRWKQEICDFYQYVISDIDFKLKVHPFKSGPHEPVILTLLLKHTQIKTFETLFYNAYIKKHHNERKIIKKYDNQHIDDSSFNDDSSEK